ncbi:peptidylprolyl isomerase [Zhongshania sp. BJYM1]|uniref:peptidylprolyl isomerase n=1 Tax=Zhongshania aquatica TaxID=2965069 RepID=UPI0022B43ECB|nr:peptidylprolyl isomerase [Marortus sp. BJYM1]
MRLIPALLLVISGLFSTFAMAEEPAANPIVVLTTSKGDITIELLPAKAPVTVENFLGYVKSGFYNGTIFHRVIRRFAVQGGGFTADMVEKPNGEPIINESKTSKLSNDRWTVAMARTDDPNSARSQFFINMRMNLDLDSRMGRDGYAVFGKVIDGQNIVRDIAISKTHSVGHMDDVPVEPILIISTTLK